MYHYLIIEAQKEIKEYRQALFEAFTDVVTIIKYEVYKKSLVLFLSAVDHDFLDETIKSLNADFYDEIRIYFSKEFEDLQTLNENYNIIKKVLEKTPLTGDFFLNNKELLTRNIKNVVDEPLKKAILGKYLKNREMIKTIKIYLANNQNTSLASQKLFLHRNTLMQRLDKFKTETGFDVRKFIDGYLIYQLLNTN